MVRDTRERSLESFRELFSLAEEKLFKEMCLSKASLPTADSDYFSAYSVILSSTYCTNPLVLCLISLFYLFASEKE